MQYILSIIIIFSLLSTFAKSEDINKGLLALDRGDCKTANKELLPLYDNRDILGLHQDHVS